jgi:hypothetical protein
MHINPAIVDGAKMIVGTVTAAGSLAVTVMAAAAAMNERGSLSLVARSAIATVLVLFCFQVLPHPPVGVSEVHLILGSTLFLVLGAGPAAIGLALGLLLQGLVFAPFDLPQYGMNVTTLLAPLFALHLVARRLIAPATAYVDLRYGQVLALSATYQGGIVAWVAFWTVLHQGTGAMADLALFGAAYLTVILVEPLVDLAVLAGAKAQRGLKGSGLVTPRLYA